MYFSDISLSDVIFPLDLSLLFPEIIAGTHFMRTFHSEYQNSKGDYYNEENKVVSAFPAGSSYGQL